MNKNRHGFTLIELLVVIAIIAILAAILFPVFMSAKESAGRANCVGNLKQLGTAFRVYMDDNGGKYPGTNKYDGNDSAHGAWVGRVAKYVRSDKVFLCPRTIQKWAVTVPVYPYTGVTKTFQISYSYNEHLQYQNCPQFSPPRYFFESEAKIRYSSRTAMVADGYQHALFHDWNDTGAWADYEGCPSGMNRIRFSDGPRYSGGVPNWNAPLVRHQGPNIVFCDLHVQSVDKDKFRAVNYPGSARPDPNQPCKEYPLIYPDALPL